MQYMQKYMHIKYVEILDPSQDKSLALKFLVQLTYHVISRYLWAWASRRTAVDAAYTSASTETIFCYVNNKITVLQIGRGKRALEFRETNRLSQNVPDKTILHTKELLWDVIINF